MCIRDRPMPDYLKDHPIYYAGPAKTPQGMPSGSFGPTTAGRMDSYVDQFQAAGGSMVMIAKGNRSKQVTDACHKHGGFYLGSIGGPAAILAANSIKKVECLEYPELGMEAIWKIEVENFPAFILVDDKGNDFFKMCIRDRDKLPELLGLVDDGNAALSDYRETLADMPVSYTHLDVYKRQLYPQLLFH